MLAILIDSYALNEEFSTYTYLQAANDFVNYVMSFIIHGVAKISMNIGLMHT